MPTDLIKYAFVAGELSPTFYGRTDLTKYDLAMAEAFNCFVDYRGGLSSRPGFEFVDYLPDFSTDSIVTELIQPPKFFTYLFESDAAFNFVGVLFPLVLQNAPFGNASAIRFLQNGHYVLEPAVTVTDITLASPAVITAIGCAYAEGDWVRFPADTNLPYELRNRTFSVKRIDDDSFSLYYITTGLLVDSTAFTALAADSTVSRILTVFEVSGAEEDDPTVLTYLPDEYVNLGIKQYHDTIHFTHGSHRIVNLIRSNDPADGISDTVGNVWHLEYETTPPRIVGPTITSFSTSTAGMAQTIFAVTAVYDDGRETLRGPLKLLENIVNYTATEGSVSVVWTPDPKAVHYNVYRSIVAVTETLSDGSELGFVGQSKGTKFTDPNIIPDFTRTPPLYRNPFAVRPIHSIEVTNPGSGYDLFSTVIQRVGIDDARLISADVIVQAGEVVNIHLHNGGSNYDFGEDQAGQVEITGAGSGATASITVVDSLGTYPSVSAVFQQRQIYAASYDRPTSLDGSQTGAFDNFDISSNLIDSDAFSFTLDASSFAPIRHMIQSQAGLLLTTQEAIWVLNGGSPTEAVTPQNAVAIPQTANGVSPLHPIRVGSDLLYVEGKGHAVRLLAYNEITRTFSGDDRSLLSNHLFGQGRELIDWAYQELPFKVVWGVRSDGQLLAFTVARTEDVFAWTPCGTNGQFLAVANIRENNSTSEVFQIVNDRVYVVTQRYLQGKWRRMIERMALRNFANLEDAFCVDCGVVMPINWQEGDLNLAKNIDGVWEATTVNGDSVALAVPGQVLRAAGGVWIIGEDE